MQIIIDVLAGIGFLTVLGFVWVVFELLKEKRQEAKENGLPFMEKGEMNDGKN